MSAVHEGHSWAGLSYGSTENLLAGLHETSPENIRSRFRKLRLKPFPDEIRSGTGKRIAYDLPRVLALSAVFELNRLYIPQGHAIEMVENCWPEWCHAFIAAAAEQSLLPRDHFVPSEASSLLRVRADAFRRPDGGPELLSAVIGKDPAIRTAGLPALEVDAGRIVTALNKAVAATSAITDAFGDLTRAFGWTDPETPHRAAIADMSRGRGFLDDGPYLDRASALLNCSESLTQATHPIAYARLQALSDYLQSPAPIDRWKADVGEDESRPRLKHLLNYWAASIGLNVSHSYPEIAQVLAGGDVREVALQYIAAASSAHRSRGRS